MLNESSILVRLRPLPGRCVIRLDPTPTMSGSLHIPDSARDLKPTDPIYSGIVVAVSPRRGEDGTPWEEGFGPGDRVWLALRLEDLGKELVATHNTRVWASAE